jgi:hypothetical protein
VNKAKEQKQPQMRQMVFAKGKLAAAAGLA